jgi:hypothetical protein
MSDFLQRVCYAQTTQRHVWSSWFGLSFWWLRLLDTQQMVSHALIYSGPLTARFENQQLFDDYE